MTARNEVLEDHSVLVRDGRILDILPTAVAAERYAAAAVLQKNTHLLLPGMINAKSSAASLLLRGAQDHSGRQSIASSILISRVTAPWRPSPKC